MGNKQTEGPMEEDKEKNSGFSFMQEKIKEKPVYANPLVKKALRGFVWRNSASDLGAGIAADQ